MSKKAAVSKFDVDAIYAGCIARADEIAEALPAVADQLRVAAQLITLQREALMEVDCKHVMTFNVTKDMNARGIDAREPGKYCMTCGERTDKTQS